MAQTSGEAVTLSFAYFSAFLSADPLVRYDITQVTTLDRRSIGSAQETGTPYFVADITLHHRSGAIDQTLSVEGAVRGVVEIDPVPVRVRGSGSIRLDGVPVPGRPGDRRERTLLMLAGAHRVTVGTDVVGIYTSPLKVTSGPGRIDGAVVIVG